MILLHSVVCNVFKLTTFLQTFRLIIRRGRRQRRPCSEGWAGHHGGVSKGIPIPPPGPPDNALIIISLKCPLVLEAVQVGGSTAVVPPSTTVTEMVKAQDVTVVAMAVVCTASFITGT